MIVLRAALAIVGAACLLSATASGQTSTREHADRQRTGASLSNRNLSHSSQDSALHTYTIEELIEYKDLYEQKRQRLVHERTQLREKGIKDMEIFLQNHTKSEILDKVLIRLAELYYEEALEDFARKQDAFLALSEQYDTGQVVEKPREPVKDYGRSLALYHRIVEEFPQSSLVDDALYNSAFLQEDLGERQQAVELYKSFVEKFHDSRYVPYALFRIGEYYFDPQVNDLETAIATYKEILKSGDNPKYNDALYRLGWSYYKLNRYPEAISFFTMLADDLTRAKILDPNSVISNPNLLEESIEYIGISFLDHLGAQAAANYFTNLGGRDYGVDVLKKIGDTYMKMKEEYESAIQTYRLLLRMYANDSEAPLVRAKVAEAYRYLEDEQRAYWERDSLFMSYREGSSWWAANTDEKVRATGRNLAEHAIRENINLLLRRADESRAAGLYSQSVQDSRKYLEAFPKDTMAALIHWNMALTLDTKLRDIDAAFDEYLTISNRYWNSRFQRMAAENAIALAQELVVSDSSRPEVMPLRLGEIREAVQSQAPDIGRVLDLEQRPLTRGDQKLAAALDNYIKLFPHAAETAERLAQAGAVYYNKNDFANSLKYFKTLLRHFPDGPDAPYAEYLVMESYFGKFDYKSCELVAKRIRAGGNNPEYVTKARQRLAESIFLQAEDLASREEHLEAAENYRRVYEEEPGVDFADLALYNAGLEFDQAREYTRAIETYSLLADNFRASQFYLGALNNLAFDYGELGDNVNAAITFERLASEEPDSSKAEVNLYNASVFFVKAEEWERAIRVNRKFVERYPNAKDASDLFYDIANYHLKLDDVDSANEVYGEYAAKFPDSPRVVETFYRRGEYYEGRSEMQRARQEYEKAIKNSDEFKAQAKDDNPFFASESHFRLTELKYRDFADIRFALPEAQMSLAKERKKNALKDVVEGYTRVSSYGTMRLYEATYKIGAAYEQFAQSWAEQEIGEIDLNRRIVAKKEANDLAADLYERSFTFYKNAAASLERIAREYEYNLPTEANDQEAAKASPVDSTLSVARQWIQQCRDKISEVLYDIAALNDESMRQLLNAPTPESMTGFTALEYRKQLLDKYVKPLLSDILAAHQRNILEAEALQLENAWVDLSRRQITQANNLLGDEYVKLSQHALVELGATMVEYQALIDQSDVRALELAEKQPNLIDFGNSFAQAAVQTYDETLRRAMAASISARALEATAEHLLEFVYRHASTADSLGGAAESARKSHLERFRNSGLEEFQDAAMLFEENVFALAESKKTLLALGFAAMKEYDIQSIWDERIMLALVRNDPGNYAQELGLQVAEVIFTTDESWLISAAYAASWNAPDFVQDGWQPAGISAGGVLLGDRDAKALWLDKLNGVAMHHDSTEAVPAEWQPQSVYFRKVFQVEGLPVSGEIHLRADDSYNLFVNGEFIARVSHNATDSVSDHSHDIANSLRGGNNVIALEVQDTDNSGGSLAAVISIRTLPGWERHQTELQLKKARREETLIFERGIIPNLQ